MFNVALDGPAGAGKSSIAKAVSKKMGFVYVDTGALYRAVGLYAIRNSIDTKSVDDVTRMLPLVKVELKFVDGVQRVLLNLEDVTTDIRLPEASMAASNVSAIPSVRQFLFDLQREIASKTNCIMDGRDIGTVVLPNAEVKVFLTATPETRAKRRYDELMEKGTKVDFSEVLEDINKRDYQDTHREIAPLVPAKDSVMLDTTNFTFSEVEDKLISIIEERYHG